MQLPPLIPGSEIDVIQKNQKDLSPDTKAIEHAEENGENIKKLPSLAKDGNDQRKTQLRSNPEVTHQHSPTSTSQMFSRLLAERNRRHQDLNMVSSENVGPMD